MKAFAALREVRYVRTEPIQLCLQRHYAPYAREAIRCRHELDAAIVGGKTADDLRKLFVVWRDATQQRNALSPFQERRSEDYEIGKAYQAVVDAVAATESPDLNAEKIPALRWEVGPQARQLGPTRSALFLARLDETIARISKRTHDPFRSEMATIRQQLGGIRDPAALMTFAAGLPDRSAPGQDAGRSTTRPALRRTLLLLAEAWSATDLEMLRQVRGVAAAEDVTFYAPLQVLVARVERDILAAELNLPELTKEPLASMAPDAAMEALCDALASRGEWRSLLRFVEARLGNSPGRQDPGLRDSAAAIKAYLIGQNQELAGLNAEAAAYYRQTLATLAARGPTREAVARLKALHGQIKQPTR